MTEIKSGLTLGLKRNLTSAAGEQQNSVYTDSSDFEKKGNAATICVAVIIFLTVLVLCAFLLYRQLNRRKKQLGIHQEKARREFIRQAVRLKLQELEHIPDSTPWLEQTKTRPSSVTFGDVILINPSDRPMDSPVLDNRKHDGNRLQHQAYHQLHHHHSIYNPSKQRLHHNPHRPDYPKMNQNQQDRLTSLQRQLNVHKDHARDNKIRMYSNSDHHRLSVHKKFEPATEHNQKASMNSKNIFMDNNEHHRLSAHELLEPSPEQGQETCMKSANIMMHNNGHHRLSADKKFGPQTEQVREASINSTNILMCNNEHHRLTSHKQLQPTPEHARETTMNSTHRSQMYTRHNSNRGLVNDANSSERSAPFNSQAVLHNGYSQRKRRSATIPMDGDAVAY